MTVMPLLAVGFIMKIAAVLFILCSVILILVILVQKGKGGGLSAAFSGGAAGGILGAKTKEPMTWFTIILVGIFLTLAVVLAKFYRPDVSDFGAASPAAQQQPQLPDQTGEADEGVDVNLPAR